MPVRELNISDIAAETANATAVSEANRPKTVPTANYRLKLRDVKAQIGDSADSKPYLHFQVDALDLTTGERRGTLFFNASWVESRKPDGKLMKDFILFSNMVKALDVAPAPSEVIRGFSNSDLQARVTETLQSPEKDRYLEVGRDVQPHQVDELLASGYTITNYVQSISRLR